MGVGSQRNEGGRESVEIFFSSDCSSCCSARFSCTRAAIRLVDQRFQKISADSFTQLLRKQSEQVSSFSLFFFLPPLFLSTALSLFLHLFEPPSLLSVLLPPSLAPRCPLARGLETHSLYFLFFIKNLTFVLQISRTHLERRKNRKKNMKNSCSSDTRRARKRIKALFLAAAAAEAIKPLFAGGFSRKK